MRDQPPFSFRMAIFFGVWKISSGGPPPVRRRIAPEGRHVVPAVWYGLPAAASASRWSYMA
jgi:hypothetical protein